MPRNIQNAQLWVPGNEPDGSDGALVNDLNPLPVRMAPSESFLGAGYSADLMWKLAKAGRIFTAGDADTDDMVTGLATGSFTSATPTFLLDVPDKTTAIPLVVNMQQGGSVGGGTVFVFITVDDQTRNLSGGTVEKAYSPLGTAPQSRLISLPTVSADTISFGQRVWGTQIGQDVAPAEGAVQAGVWRPEYPLFLRGPASLLIYSHAATTGPTWVWSIAWAEMSTAELFA